MQQSTRFLKSPKPVSEVVALLEKLLQAAQAGHLRALAVVAVNPAHEDERAAVGDLSNVRATILIGGLSKLANEILKSQ